MNTSNTFLNIAANAGDERSGKKPGHEVSFGRRTIGLLSFLLLNMSIGIEPAAAAAVDQKVCPPERIIILDGQPLCEEVIEPEEELIFNPRLNLPDSRGGGIPTNDGYIAKSKDRAVKRTHRRGPTNTKASVKARKKITKKVEQHCKAGAVKGFKVDITYFPPGKDPQKQPAEYFCSKVMLSIPERSVEPSYRVRSEYWYDEKGVRIQSCYRTLSKEEGGTWPLPPGAETNTVAWRCPQIETTPAP